MSTPDAYRDSYDPEPDVYPEDVLDAEELADRERVLRERVAGNRAWRLGGAA